MEKATWKAFINLGYGRTATSPLLALKQAMLRDSDQFLMNRDRLLSRALNELDQTTKAAPRDSLALVGNQVFAAMCDWLQTAATQGQLMSHDVVVGNAIARIITGGDCSVGTMASEQDLFDAERQAFVALASTPETQARIISMLDASKSLRN
jgi:3-hydroxyacyl-CoA dehydrogenase